MRLKLDENLSHAVMRRLTLAGHDVATVPGDPARMSVPDHGLWVVQPGRIRVYQPHREP